MGCFLPVLPGLPLSLAGMLLLHSSRFAQFEIWVILVLAFLTIVIQILDYIVPIWGTKKFGGSRLGAWGSILGLIAGMFFLPAIGPFGIITILAGPFFGAWLGELIAGQKNKTAIRAAFGSFVGFIAGTFMKIALASVITILCVKNVVSNSF